MRAFVKYLLSGVSIWVLVDYTTAFNPDTARWIQHMPDIWLFYLGYPCARAPGKVIVSVLPLFSAETLD